MRPPAPSAIRFVDEVIRRLPFRVLVSKRTTAPSSNLSSTGTSRSMTSAMSISDPGRPT